MSGVFEHNELLKAWRQWK